MTNDGSAPGGRGTAKRGCDAAAASAAASVRVPGSSWRKVSNESSPGAFRPHIGQKVEPPGIGVRHLLHINTASPA